jgi:hypothetical protein
MGYNFSNRFPQIVAARTVLSVRSCLIDERLSYVTTTASPSRHDPWMGDRNGEEP